MILAMYEQQLTSQSSLFFCTDTSTAYICTLSLHDALPIFRKDDSPAEGIVRAVPLQDRDLVPGIAALHEQREIQAGRSRSEEHTSELQSQSNLVCRLLLG